MKAGDQIETVTKAVGIEPCKGCKERKLLFNRRGWIGGTAATLYLAKNALLTKMWKWRERRLKSASILRERSLDSSPLYLVGTY